MNIKIPDLEELELIEVRLEKERVITFSDNRKVNSSRTTKIPLDLKKQEGRCGIYIILKGNEPGYVGMTNELYTRVKAHPYLNKFKECRYIRFLELKDKKQMKFYELLYKFVLLKKIDFENEYKK